MKVSIALVLLLGTMAFAQVTRVPIGDRLIRDFTQYFNLPDSAQAATAAGWHVLASNSCDPHLGIAYTPDASGATKEHPLTLYFTAQGQAAGVGVNVFGEMPDNLVSQGYWRKVADGQFSISVSFRDPADMCASTPSELILGDRIVINQESVAFEIPILESDLVKQGWVVGSCFYGMGYHWFYDIKSHGNMTWQAANLLPIVPMYSNGSINAFFFASSVIQQGLLDTHWWEKIPLPDFLMCKNWCDKACTFHDTNFWSTLHIYMNDYTKVECPGGCKEACCPAAQVSSWF